MKNNVEELKVIIGIENDPFSEFRFKKPSNDRNDPKIEELFFTPPPVSPTLSQSLPGSTSSEQLISSMDASSDLSFERRIARVLYDFAGVCEDQTFFAVRFFFCLLILLSFLLFGKGRDEEREKNEQQRGGREREIFKRKHITIQTPPNLCLTFLSKKKLIISFFSFNI